MIKSIYVIGSLRNPAVTEFSNQIQALGIEAFSSWYGAGERADDAWKEYQIARGRNYGQALQESAAQHVFKFDKMHLDRTDAAVLLLPAGKSGHLELGYTIGRGKPGYIVFEQMPEDRWDVMYCFATKVFFSMQEFLEYLKNETHATQLGGFSVMKPIHPIVLPEKLSGMSVNVFVNSDNSMEIVCYRCLLRMNTCLEPWGYSDAFLAQLGRVPLDQRCHHRRAES